MMKLRADDEIRAFDGISWCWTVLREFQDGGRIKLESRAKRWQIKWRSKEDLSIDTTFDPP
jgi:hypothetical protein